MEQKERFTCFFMISNLRMSKSSGPPSCRVRVIQELRDLVEQKEQFIALMSHELRTPLNGIIGLSNTLLVDVAGGRPCCGAGGCLFVCLVGYTGKGGTGR